MIEQLEIENFKSIRQACLEFGKINIFLGANGAGKTNILEAIGVISAAVFGVVDDEALLRRGIRPGVPRLYKTSNRKYAISPHIAFCVKEGTCQYKVSLLNPLDNPRSCWHFKTERLESEELATSYTRGVKLNPNPAQGGIPGILSTLDPKADVIRFLMDLREYALYNPNTLALRGINTDVQMRPPVGLSGGGLSEGLQDILDRIPKDDVLADTLDEVVSLFDWVQDVSTSTQVGRIAAVTLPRTKRTVTFTDAFMKEKYNRLTASDASEGILYALFLFVLCMSESGPRIFSIDNVDQALNPRLIKRLIKMLVAWFDELVPEKQLFCTAHNPVILDSLDISSDIVRLFAVDRDSDGLTSVRRISVTPKLIEESKKHHMPLSQLWTNGYLGGVPNV